MPTRRNLLKMLGLGGLAAAIGQLGRAATAKKPGKAAEEKPLVTVRLSLPDNDYRSSVVVFDRDGRRLAFYDVEIRPRKGEMPLAVLSLTHPSVTGLTLAKKDGHSMWRCALTGGGELVCLDVDGKPVDGAEISAVVTGGRARASYFQVVCPARVTWLVSSDIDMHGRDGIQEVADMRQECRVEAVDEKGNVWRNNTASGPPAGVFYNEKLGIPYRAKRLASAVSSGIPTTVLG